MRDHGVSDFNLGRSKTDLWRIKPNLRFSDAAEGHEKGHPSGRPLASEGDLRLTSYDVPFSEPPLAESSTGPLP